MLKNNRYFISKRANVKPFGVRLSQETEIVFVLKHRHALYANAAGTDNEVYRPGNRQVVHIQHLADANGYFRVSNFTQYDIWSVKNAARADDRILSRAA